MVSPSDDEKRWCSDGGITRKHTFDIQIWYHMHIWLSRNIAYIWVYVKDVYLTMWVYVEDVYLTMCNYVENVWFDDSDDVWTLHIQLGDYLMKWILATILVMMFWSSLQPINNWMWIHVNIVCLRWICICDVNVYSKSIHVFVFLLCWLYVSPTDCRLGAYIFVV